MLEKMLHGIEKPGRYIGSEVNAYRKSFEDADVRFVLAFPDVYEVGFSHLGLRLLYHALNRMEGTMADRVYAPWFDFEKRLRTARQPLRGIESERPLSRFDFVGFSLQYELSYTNILTILDLGQIPLKAENRDPRDPWVIAGGPCAFNPEPLADLFDFIVLGEAEQVLPEVNRSFRQWRASGGTREELLREVCRIPGIYVPSFFNLSYFSDGTVSAIEPRFSDYGHVEKRLVSDLDLDAPIPEQPLVPLIDVVHNRLGLEIARGCTRGCRFCQAGFIYRPVRERSPQSVLRHAERALANSGFEELSLLSLSTGDYCQIQGLLAELMHRFASRKVAVSLPSMRVGTLTPELMELIRGVRKTGFTLAPEAGSERLRRVINKGIVDEDLLSAAQSAFQLGWRLLKLYFMTGLPTEKDEDLDALVDLCLEVWRLGKPSRAGINASVSTFVPKPQTPFQWSAQLSRPLIVKRIETLGERLRRPGLRFKWHHPGHSFLEAVFARGDRRLGEVLRRAWELGARFDGWTEIFREDLWEKAFRDADLDPAFYACRERGREEILPWDHLSARVEKSFLWDEYERALQEEFTPDCRSGRCSACGVCDHKSTRPVLHTDDSEMELQSGHFERSDEDRPGLSLYWLQYSKLGRIRFFGQLEIAQGFARAIRRADLPAAYSGGFHPHIKLSFGEALPLGLESEAEEAYLSLTEKMDPAEIRSRLNRVLPEGLRVEAVARTQRHVRRPPSRRVTYRVSNLIPWHLHAIVQNWSRRGDELLVKKTKKGYARAKLGDVLLNVRPIDASSLEMELYEGPRVCFRPTMVLQHLMERSCHGFGAAMLRPGIFDAPRGEAGLRIVGRKAGADHIAGCRIVKVNSEPLEENQDVRRAHH